MTTSTTAATKSPSQAWRGPMIDANRQALDFQKRVFDTSFDMVASMQERREEAITKWTENSERLPAEAKSLVQEWVRLFQDGPQFLPFRGRRELRPGEQLPRLAHRAGGGVGVG